MGLRHCIKCAVVALVALITCGVHLAQASVVLSGTRVIYHGKKKEVTVTVTNNNASPVLIQNWMDAGKEKAIPGKIAVPFVLTPPINRVDAGKAQTLRITYLGSPPLPQDKESVFWINVLEVPAKAKGIKADQSRLNIAFRSRIKMFYRPEGLKGNAFQAISQLKWNVASDGGVDVTNPTPYFVSLQVLQYGKEILEGKMIGPGEAQHYKFQNAKVTDLNKLNYHAINDYGALTEAKAQK
ncbi:fimbria/pilus periplasmic chaperone [Yokenella regensburgei]|uniref:fimbria/pilus periplasmic chaperone n=1 Tax=Yokenella regensburgei TaxID=158877 RepID=UPI003F14B7F9